jgi:hypothetical protein
MSKKKVTEMPAPAAVPTVKELPTLAPWETAHLRSLLDHKNEAIVLLQTQQAIIDTASKRVGDFVNKLLTGRGLDIKIYGVANTLDRFIEMSASEKATVMKAIEAAQAAQAAATAQVPVPTAPPAPQPGPEPPAPSAT